MLFAWPHIPTMLALLGALTTLRDERAAGGCASGDSLDPAAREHSASGSGGAVGGSGAGSGSGGAATGGSGGAPTAGRAFSLPLPPSRPAARAAALQSHASAGPSLLGARGAITSPFAGFPSGSLDAPCPSPSLSSGNE